MEVKDRRVQEGMNQPHRQLGKDYCYWFWNNR